MASSQSFFSWILQHEILWNGSEEMMVLNGFFQSFFSPIFQVEILWSGSQEMMVLNGFCQTFFLPNSSTWNPVEW